MTKQPFALGRFARLVGEPRARGKCQPNGASCRGQSATGEREAGDFPLSLSWALPKGQYKVLTFFPHLLIPAASTAPHHASSMVLYRFRSLPSRRWTIYPLLSLLITWFPQVYKAFIVPPLLVHFRDRQGPMRPLMFMSRFWQRPPRGLFCICLHQNAPT